MKKIIASFLLLSVICIQNAAAKPVKEDEAKQFAKNWTLEKWSRKVDSVSTKEKAVVVQQVVSEESLYYVLSFPQGGWIIISGDDVAYPVIAFSPTGTYSSSNRPVQFTEWMENVKKDISSAIKAKYAPLPKAAAAWKRFNVSTTSFAPKSFSASAEASSVEAASAGPLLSTTWDQGTYYNDYCPADTAGLDGHVYVGCVAVAMAQVMKYHNHPTTGSSSHSYYHSTYGTRSVNFGATTYNWASMPNSLSGYDSDVAKLLYHVGVSVDMNYGVADGSAASTSDTVYALKTYFKYSDSLYFAWKSDYSSNEWTALLRTEIDNKRPVLYRGQGTGGHAFVCDGYSGSDHFHFNWGWSGDYQEEYFYLNDLTPGSGDFTSSQGAVIGIKPASTPDNHPDLVVKSPSVDDNTLKPGEVFKIFATVRNAGNASSPAIILRYYRSTNDSISTNDSEIGIDAVDGLPGGGTSPENKGNREAPSSPGTYWVGACVDAVNGESSTSNNCSDGVKITVASEPPVSQPPVGYFDSADCSALSGWTKDPDTTSSIYVHFYQDGPAGTGTYIGSTFADIYRGDLSYADKNHGFSFALSDSLNDGAAHQIYAYAIDDAGGTNPLLASSPKTVQCGLTPDQAAAVMSVINEILMEDVDSDGDGILDSQDNCPSVSNTDQKNTDGDSIGDACDGDDDNDGFSDISDAFPLNPNEWIDTDKDGIGNNADLDDDNDVVADGQDAFPLDPKESKDADGDGIGDNADPDDDNDGIPDALENQGKAVPAILKLLLKSK